jgi:hypothetical protein
MVVRTGAVRVVAIDHESIQVDGEQTIVRVAGEGAAVPGPALGNQRELRAAGEERVYRIQQAERRACALALTDSRSCGIACLRPIRRRDRNCLPPRGCGLFRAVRYLFGCLGKRTKKARRFGGPLVFRFGLGAYYRRRQNANAAMPRPIKHKLDGSGLVVPLAASRPVPNRK